MSEQDTYLPGPVRAPAPDTGRTGQKHAGLGLIITRIEEAIDAETTAIRTDLTFDIKASNARKSRCLYELNKAMKGMPDANSLERHRDDIIRLREKLARNEAAISAHLNAVNEVAGMLREAIERSEADGTYRDGPYGGAAIR